MGKFQAMKKVENLLENKFSDKFRSRYAMVCYGGEGNVSYANAKYLGLIQMDILESLCSGLSDASPVQDQVNFTKAEQLIDTKLLPELSALKIDLSTVRH